MLNGGHFAVKVGSMERRKGWDDFMLGDVILQLQSSRAQAFRAER